MSNNEITDAQIDAAVERLAISAWKTFNFDNDYEGNQPENVANRKLIRSVMRKEFKSILSGLRKAEANSLRWISVNESLPDYDFDAIVKFSDGIGVYVAYFKDGKWVSRNSSEVENIAFWTKFPD